MQGEESALQSRLLTPSGQPRPFRDLTKGGLYTVGSSGRLSLAGLLMAAAPVAGQLPFHNSAGALRHTLNSDSPPQLKELGREDKVRKGQL